MIAVPKTTHADPELATGNPALASLTADERADLVWGDEAYSTVTFHPALAVHVGQAAQCVDGRAGRVVKTTRDPYGRLRQVIVRLPGLWGREVSVPVDWIGAVDRTGVRLVVDQHHLRGLPDYWTDTEIALEGRLALNQAGLFSGTNYCEITVRVHDGVAALSGHVLGSRAKVAAEQAMLTAQGVRAVHNLLVTDDDLVNLVAQALSHDDRTRRERIYVAVNHGVVSLSGSDNSALTRADAEQIAASVPSVRGIRNFILGPGGGMDSGNERVLQPRPGQEVLASDMVLGRVERVIINPHNRRVAAIVVHGRIPDRRRALPRTRPHEMPKEGRHVVIPIAEVGFITEAAVQLSISGITAAGHPDFAPQDFSRPDRAWRPPYPYADDECLWTTP